MPPSKSFCDFTRRNTVLLGAALVVLFAGCTSQRYLMPTPNFVSGALANPFEEVPEPLEKTQVEVLYATDRKLITNPEGLPAYSGERRGDLALGRVTVNLGEEDLTWEELRQQSLLRERTIKIPLSVTPPQELIQFATTPFELRSTVYGPRLAGNVESIQKQSEAWLHQEMRRRLAQTSHKEAYVFIHGYNTSFDEAVMSLAEMWHFSGRRGVPIVYSWPAKKFGVLKGYAYDRESGEFTIFHLKQFLRALSSTPELERINVVAHSRGADVIASALRELMLETRGSAPPQGRGRVERTSILKIGNLVLVAPDIDTQVAGQRYIAENIFNAATAVTIYSSPRDKALGLVEFLFGGNRIGSLKPGEFTEQERATIALMPDTDFIDVDVETDFFGHGYFHKSREVSSDLYFLMIRDQAPGIGFRSRLEPMGDNFWKIREGYPLEPKPAPESDEGESQGVLALEQTLTPQL